MGGERKRDRWVGGLDSKVLGRSGSKFPRMAIPQPLDSIIWLLHISTL